MSIYNLILSVDRPQSLAQRMLRGILSRFRRQQQTFPTAQELIQQHAPGKTFTDVGCMWAINGAMSFLAEECGATRVIAVDVLPATPEFTDQHSRLGSKVQFVCGDINKTDTVLQVGKSDVVFCRGVLYHMPSPYAFLERLHSICGDVLLLHSMLVPEIPGLQNAAIFYPLLDEKQRNRFNLGTGVQHAITGPYAPEIGYSNWFWGLTASCVESLLVCAGFTVTTKCVNPFDGWFICHVAEPKVNAGAT